MATGEPKRPGRAPLPSYDELPLEPLGARNAWGLFGDDDSIGRLNLLGPPQVLEAARMVRKGTVFRLDAPLNAFDPPLDPTRALARHRVLEGRGPSGIEHLDDALDDYFPQISSQWDSLAHVAAHPDRFYNGATPGDVLGGRRNTIDHWPPVVGRGVLLDVERAVREGTGGDRDTSHGAVALGVDDLEAARRRAGVDFSSGCILLVHTGFGRWYAAQDDTTKASLGRSLEAPGVEHTEAMARYLWDSGAAAIASDTFSVEVWPPDWAEEAWNWGFLHRALLGRLGLPLGELWALDALANDCAEDGVYECLVASAPLPVPEGIGSPASALAVK